MSSSHIIAYYIQKRRFCKSSTKSPDDGYSVEYFAHTGIDAVYGMEGEWGLVNQSGDIIIEPQYVYPFIECGDNYQVMLPYECETIDGKKNILTLKHGLIDKKGKIIIPIKYLYMEAMDNTGTYFRMVDGKLQKSAVIDKNNNIAVPFQYDYVAASPDLGLMTKSIRGLYKYPDSIHQVKICNNDLYGVYDLDLKKELIEPKYKYLKIVGRNRFMVGEDYDDCNTLIDEEERSLSHRSIT